MTRTSSPILWYGDLVDFGSFATSVSDGCAEQEITFTFAVDSLETQPAYFIDEHGAYKEFTREYKNIKLEITIGPEVELTQIRKLTLSVEKPKASFELHLGSEHHVSSLIIDGEEVLKDLSPMTFVIDPGTIFPELRSEAKRETQNVLYRARRRRGETEILERLQAIFRRHLPKKMKPESLIALTSRLISTHLGSRESIAQVAGETGVKSWDKLIENIVGPDSLRLFRDVHVLLATNGLVTLMADLASYLRTTIAATLYIGPARARSERYYRYQDLSVSEIDPDGKNFPMFLNSLSGYQMERLSDWIERLFGYGVAVTRQSGHISITLTSRGASSNIVDTGYGVSQILPVLGQIWWARFRLNQIPVGRMSLLAIEQPELHLHPAHQALLADALVGEIGLSAEQAHSTEHRINFLVETHSETLVNRLGELIAKGLLNHKDVQIVLFESFSPDEQVTAVKTSSFDTEGRLVNWPYGFFQPSVK